MFNVDANLFRLAYLATSTEKTRYYLAGVSIEAHPGGGVLLTATDGHQMLCIYDATGTIDGSPVIVRLEKAQLTACKPHSHDAVHNVEHKPPGRRLTAGLAASLATVMQADGKQIAIQADWCIDGTFPDWRRVVPRNIPDVSAPVCFAGAMFDTFEAVSRGLGRGGVISIAADGPGNPALIRFPKDNRAFGVLMPSPRSALGAEATKLPGFMIEAADKSGGPHA